MILSRILNIFSTNIRLCFIEIRSNRIRTVITSFGIFLAVASYLVNLSLIRGIDNETKLNLEEIGGLKIITIKNKKPSTENEAIVFGKSSHIKLNEIEEISKTLPYISTVLPKKEMEWSMVIVNGKNTWTKPIAVSQDYLRVYNYKVEKGRAFTPDDHNEKQNVCLIGTEIFNKLFPNDNSAIGKTISMSGQSFTIIGIIKSEDKYSSKAFQFLFPYSFYTYKVNSNSNNIGEIAIELKSSDFIDKAQHDFTNLLKQKHRGIENFVIKSNQSKISEMRSASAGIKVLAGIISVCMLFMGGISIMNIMFAAIGDRIREIGIRKALGAKKTDIFLQFVIESIVVSFVGGIPGLLLGASVILFPKGFFPYNPYLSSLDFILAIAFTLTIGMLSGLFPAMRAAKMLPVNALRF